MFSMFLYKRYKNTNTPHNFMTPYLCNTYMSHHSQVVAPSHQKKKETENGSYQDLPSNSLVFRIGTHFTLR